MLLGEKIGIILWLIIGMRFDFACKKIPRWYAYASVSIGIIVGLLIAEGDWWSSVLGGSIGVMFFLLAKISKEQIGYGDAFVMIGMGAVVGLEKMIWILCYSFFVLFLTGIILLLSKRVKRETSIAFIPFLFLGYCFTLFV